MTQTQITELSQPIVDLFTEMEDVLLRRIAVQLGADGDLSDASKWRIRQLARAGLLDKEAVKTIRSYTGIQSDMLDVVIETAALHEIDHLDYAVQAADAAALSGAAVPPAEDTAYSAMKAFRRQAQQDINAVNTVMRYKTKQAFVTAVNSAFFDAQKSQRVYNALGMGTAEVLTGAESLQTGIRDAIGKLSEKGIPAFVDAAGREWSPEAYVRMDIRSTVGNTARQANFDRCEAHGINLIEVDAHAGARPLCAPYQGHIYSLDGSSGTVKDGSGTEYSYEPLTSTSYGQAAGLFGINCGHHNYPFKPGVNFKRYFPLETEEQLAENSKQYKAFQKQRALERNVRAAKRDCMMCDAAGDKEGFAKASQKLARRKEAYSSYCKSAGLHQRKDRTQVYGFDKSVSGKATWANRKSSAAGLTTSNGSGKINVIHTMSAKGFDQKPPDFSLYPVSENLEAVAECKKKLMELGLKESEIDLKGIKNADVLKPFVDRIAKIKTDTGMKIPPIITTELVEGEKCTIAGYKPYEGVLHLSSKYFNSKDATLDAMKEWTNNGLFPKQAKTINYLAEHEMAHARIDDEILKNDEAIKIHRQFCKSKYANDNDDKIAEFFADSVAVYRISPNETPPKMLEAVNYLKKVNVQKEGKG